MPEINAYINFFNKRHGFSAYDSATTPHYNIKDYDVVWEFKGIGRREHKNKIIIHEYASLSTGYLPRIKNHLKSYVNTKPSLRVFLNENVKSGFNFKDDIDFVFRDMGIDENFFKYRGSKKEFDFIYVGNVSKKRKIDKLLAHFSNKSYGNLCLVGNVDNNIYRAYKSSKNIIFTGPVPYSEVPRIASKAVYGINFVPCKYPFNLQTSTKLLEYVALGLNVITTDYKWVREFEAKHSCSFFKINSEFYNFDLSKLKKFRYISQINRDEFLWDNIIERSGIEQKLNAIIQHYR